MSQRSQHRAYLRPASAAAGVLALVLAGCVGGGAPSSPAADDGPTPGEDARLSVISQLGDNPALQGVLQRLNEAYMEANPGVTVDIEYLTLEDLTKTLPTTLASGAGPDVFDYDANESSLGELARSELVLPLDPYADEYGWTESLAVSAASRTTYDDALFGVPRSSEAVGLFYNADAFTRLRIGAPTSYDAFIAAAERLQEEGLTPIAFGNKDQWPSGHLVGAALHSMTALSTIESFETLSGSGSWTDPSVLESFDEAARWAAEGYITPDFNGVSFDDALKSFYAGQAGMFVEGTGVTPDIIENMADTSVEFVSFPMRDEDLEQQAQGGVGGAWAISASSAAPAIAADWLDFVHFSDEAERAWLQAGVLPTTDYDGAGVDVPALVADNLSVVSAAQEGGGIGYWTGYSTSPLVTDAWNSGGQLLLAGDAAPDEVAASLDEALEQARSNDP